MYNSNEILFNRLFLSIYFFLSLSVCVLIKIGNSSNKKTDQLQNLAVVFYAILFLFLFGFRGFDIGVDTETYLSMFENSKDLVFVDFGFGFLNRFLVDKISNRGFIFLMAFMYIIPMILALFRIIKTNRLLLFFCITSFFFFKSMGMNTIRQGVGFSFFFLSLTYDSNKRLRYLFMFLALSIHLSIVIPIIVFEASKYIRNIKYPIFVFILCTFLSILKFNIYALFQNIPLISIADKMESYSNVDASDYKIGFRIDFFFFNLLFAIIGYHIYKNTQSSLKYLSSYFILSGFFFLMFNSGYSDRYGFLSWIFIPLIILPVLNGEKINKFINISSILSFCFFIAIIFYTIK